MSNLIIEDEFFNFGDDQISKQYYNGELIPELGKLYPYREPSPGLYQGERTYSNSESHFSHYKSECKKWIDKEQKLLHNDETSSRYKSIIEGEIRKRSESRPSVQYPYYIDRVYRARNGLPEPEGIGQSPILKVECSCLGSGYYQGGICRFCSGRGYLTKVYCRCCLGSGNGYIKTQEHTYIHYSRIVCECCNGSKTVYITLPPVHRSIMVGGKRGAKHRKNRKSRRNRN